MLFELITRFAGVTLINYCPSANYIYPSLSSRLCVQPRNNDTPMYHYWYIVDMQWLFLHNINRACVQLIDNPETICLVYFFADGDPQTCLHFTNNFSFVFLLHFLSFSHILVAESNSFWNPSFERCTLKRAWPQPRCKSILYFSVTRQKWDNSFKTCLRKIHINVSHTKILYKQPYALIDVWNHKQISNI